MSTLGGIGDAVVLGFGAVYGGDPVVSVSFW
jgi:hypothetical protein